MPIKKSGDIIYVDNVSDLAGINADKRTIAVAMDAEVPLSFDGTNWVVSNRTVVLKSQVVVNGLNANTNTKVYTTPASALTFYPTMVLFKPVNISGVLIRPTVSVGSNSPNYDNISSASLLNTILSTIGATGGSPQLVSTTYPISGGTDIYARVTTAGSATSYTFTVYLIGFYDN